MSPKGGGAVSVPVWLLAAALVVPLFGLGSPLLEVDDARYAEVPREMAVSGDWVVPTLNGLPYVEKPPLWYWAAASSIKLFGASEGAARLPMALFSALGALGAWWLGAWLFSPATGRAGALAVSTSALWLFLAHNMTLDLPLSVLLLWTTALALRAMERPKDAGWAAPAAWAAAGLAFLAKGLISLLLPVAWVVGLAILFPRWREGARKLISPLGILLFALIAAPWFLAVQSRRPDFLHTFFVEQHFQRYLSPKYSRAGAWWFFLVVVPAGLLPWTSAFLAGLAAAVRDPLARRAECALAAWTLGVVLFFSLSHSKLATYALPVFPHAVLLACAAIDRGLPAWAKSLSQALGAVLGLAGLALLLVASGVVPAAVRLPPGLTPENARVLGALAAALLAALGAAQWFGAARGARVLGLGGAAAGLFALAGLHAASPLMSAKAVSEAVRAAARPGDRLWTYGCYLHGLPFYTGMPVDKIVYWVGELHYAKREEKHAPRFGDDNAVTALPQPGGRIFLVLRSFERPHFESVLPRAARAEWRDFGPWALAVIEPR